MLHLAWCRETTGANRELQPVDGRLRVEQGDAAAYGRRDDGAQRFAEGNGFCGRADGPDGRVHCDKVGWEHARSVRVFAQEVVRATRLAFEGGEGWLRVRGTVYGDMEE